MSDENTQPDAANDPTPAQENEDQQQSEQQDDKPETDWRAEARKWEQRAKENKRARDRLSEIEDAQKTEAEKAADALKQQTERADTAEQALLRFEVMDEQEVPAHARRLVHGSTREELEASCADVIALLGEAGKPRTPKPNPAQREGDSAAGDKDAMARAFFGI